MAYPLPTTLTRRVAAIVFNVRADVGACSPLVMVCPATCVAWVRVNGASDILCGAGIDRSGTRGQTRLAVFR
eukprot:1192549-Lingulodinium_polyedra.AAC.1